MVLLLALLLAQQNEAEQAWRQLEEKFAKAESLQIEYESSVEGEAAAWTKGSLQGIADRVRFDANGMTGTKSFKLRVTSDGFDQGMLRTEFPAPPFELPPQPVLQAPPRLAANLRTAFLRGGGSLLQDYAAGQYRTVFENGASKEVPLSYRVGEFRSTADAIEFRLSRDGDVSGIEATVRLWIDAKTQMPLQRRTVYKGRTSSITVVETYRLVNLAATIDPSTFTVPEGLFRRMEAKLADAKTLKVRFGKSSLTLENGTFRFDAFDGKAEAPQVAANVRAGFIRLGGAWLSGYAKVKLEAAEKRAKGFPSPVEEPLETMFRLDRFEAGTREGKVQAVKYRVVGADKPWAVTIWIDESTLLPVKRSVNDVMETYEFTSAESR